jgi:hypothetical protein
MTRRRPRLFVSSVGAAAALCATAVLLASAAASSHGVIVLGSKNYIVHGGAVGYGTSRPTEIFNGGDPSGDITHIHWSSWGGNVAVGQGRYDLSRPHGGYYLKLVTIELRAYDIGRCTREGPSAYLKLAIRTPLRPGRPLASWSLWQGLNDTLCSYL